MEALTDKQKLEVSRRNLHQAMKAYNRIPSATNYNKLMSAMIEYQQHWFKVN